MTKILVVEDNELNMKLFYDILTFQKYEVVKAFDGLEAYNLIKNNKFDLIILDILLPKISGLDLVKKLNLEKIQYPNVIITSACAMDDDKKRASELGIDTYLVKPIDINTFIKIVKEKLN